MAYWEWGCKSWVSGTIMQFTYPSLIRADMSSDWVVGNMDHKLMYWDWWTHNASKLEKDGSAEKINAPQSVAPHAQLKRGQNHAYNSLKMLHGGHQCHVKKITPVSTRFPHGRTTIIIETGKVKGKKERHPRGFFLMLPHAYVTGTVPEGCVVWGNVGERDSAREAGLPVLL